jgi:glutamyl-tRNA reductase
LPLVYLGISLKNQQQHPLADEIKFCTTDELKSVKIPHDEYPLLLDSIKSLGFIDEISLVSTCNRFEIISFLKEGYDSVENINKIQAVIKSITKSDINLGTLTQKKAEYQFLRTFCGLNSGLIGESEISHQIEISFRQAIIMGYMSNRGLELLEKAIKLKDIITERVLKDKISYCQIALQSALKNFGNFDSSKVVVLGSGSTSLESCKSLVDFGINPKNINLIHRISTSSGQIARFKSTPGLESINYLRSKYGYHMDKVKAFVADADLLVFGIDSRNPVMSFSSATKIKIIDFNSKPSCTFGLGLEPVNYISGDKLDTYVRDYSKSRLEDQDFCLSIKMIDEIVASALGLLESVW